MPGRRGTRLGPATSTPRSLPVRERVSGPEHPSTLAIRSSLAYWTGAAGDAAGARDQLVAVLPVMERVYGPEHPTTLAIRSSLAYWTKRAEGSARAREEYAALRAASERVTGLEHPESLTARASLAYYTMIMTTGGEGGLIWCLACQSLSSRGEIVPQPLRPRLADVKPQANRG
jgi:Tetratricopeptide repeat